MSKQPREVTGRTVLIWLLSFFGLVFVANGVMIKLAASTFAGVEVASSYKAGLKFGQDVAESRAQDALHWQVSGHIGRDREASAVLELVARDKNGVALAEVAAKARLIHPADSRRDVVIDLHKVAAGSFRGVSHAPSGQWELEIALERDDERVFMSRSRVTLR
jgi:nitrogen fixation protein FixH